MSRQGTHATSSVPLSRARSLALQNLEAIQKRTACSFKMLSRYVPADSPARPQTIPARHNPSMLTKPLTPGLELQHGLLVRDTVSLGSGHCAEGYKGFSGTSLKTLPCICCLSHRFPAEFSGHHTWVQGWSFRNSRVQASKPQWPLLVQGPQPLQHEVELREGLLQRPRWLSLQC